MSYRLSVLLEGIRNHHKHNTITNRKHIKAKIQSLKTYLSNDEHLLTPDQLQEMFHTNCKKGLTQDQANENLKMYGENVLLELRSTTWCKIIQYNFFSCFQCVLWVAAFINFTVYLLTEILQLSPNHAIHYKEYLYLGIVISITIIFTGLFKFLVEIKSTSIMNEFDQMVPSSTSVIREGFDWIIPTKFVTVGDIVEMKEGDMVPADCRILICDNFATDNFIFTGQSKIIHHTSRSTDANPLKSKNMCFFGSPVIRGHARSIVIAVGENTQLGKIAGLATGLKKEQTPIAKEINYFVKLICVISIILALMFFIIFMILSYKWPIALQASLGILLANIPEGLIVTLTVILTLSARQLKNKNCLAKTLDAVETLGATSCICSDKTGTLTQNTMTVSHLFCDWIIYDQCDHTSVSQKAYTELCIAASLNLRAYFGHDTMELSIKKRRIIGDATESAILRYMEANRSASLLQIMYPKVAEIPFNALNKYQVSVHQWAEEKTYHVIMKGAPEVVLGLCIDVLTNEGVEQLTIQLKRQIEYVIFNLANMGERVIGYADLMLPGDKFPIGYIFNTRELNFPLENLRFLGAISLVDPPRKHIEKYVGLCRNAGIKVTMVTGDHPVTALAVSRKCGTITYPTAYDYAFEHHVDISDVPNKIDSQFQAAVVTGDELRETSNQVRKILERYKEVTFARISAQQKLIITEGYQALKHVVAVTGNGVNDSAALKRADIGIAMGITGNEVSKLSSDMILLDDNFASIVIGIREGRRIYENLKKTIAYILGSNTSEMMPFILYALIGIPLPLTLMLVLIINAGTNLVPAISLAFEQPEEDLMSQAPRKSNRLVTRVLLFMAYFQIGMIQVSAGLFAYFVIFAEYGFLPSSLLFVRTNWESPSITIMDSKGEDWSFTERKLLERKVQTAYFVAICLTQISDLIICKTRRLTIIKKKMTNHVLNVGMVLILLTAVLATYLPVSNHFFKTLPITWFEFFLSLPYVILMILLDELRRYFIRKNIFTWVKEETYF